MQVANNQNRPVRIYLLSEITHLIKDALLELSDYEFWVRAHLIADRWEQRSGHYYCELMDVDATGDTIARIKAIIWRHAYMKINKKLQDDNVHIPGKNPSATLLSRISRDKRFKRAKEAWGICAIDLAHKKQESKAEEEA